MAAPLLVHSALVGTIQFSELQTIIAPTQAPKILPRSMPSRVRVIFSVVVKQPPTAYSWATITQYLFLSHVFNPWNPYRSTDPRPRATPSLIPRLMPRTPRMPRMPPPRPASTKASLLQPVQNHLVQGRPANIWNTGVKVRKYLKTKIKEWWAVTQQSWVCGTKGAVRESAKRGATPPCWRGGGPGASPGDFHTKWSWHCQGSECQVDTIK